MARSMSVTFALAAGLLIAAQTGMAQAAVQAPSLAKVAKHGSLVEQAGDWEYCYWKLKRNGKWKWKCDD